MSDNATASQAAPGSRLPDLTKQAIFTMTFGFFGVNMAFSLKGKNVGSYLGLFNIAVCLPQIIGSVAGFFLVPAFGGNLSYMMLFGAVFMLIGAVTVYTVHEGC